tara:strand:- start:643 stop:981 length:339 start_codon:yes stop_codon:yes gene_type:complete
MKKIFNNLLNSLNGLKIGFKEHSFIIEIIGGVFLISYLIIADLEIILKISIIMTYFILLAFELLNTAIELLSDKITKDFDLDIKKIKDTSSAAVFVILLLLIILIILSFLIF